MPQGRSGLMRKISPPPRFDPRAVQPVASRYTDYAIPAPTSSLPDIYLLVLFSDRLLAFLTIPNDQYLCSYRFISIYKAKYDVVDSGFVLCCCI
jgi:hypothetical protein